MTQLGAGREEDVTFTVTEARTKFGEVVNRARYSNAPVRLTQHGKTAAWVISDELMDRLRQFEDERDLALLTALKNEGGDEWVPHEEVNDILDKQLAPEAEE
ncbi:hypothetical protein GCM10009839_40530 [Catenulispora yoronensis]|uniref:Antitoxin n=2 Tax=Catenulispora yoronensis TaxID=450799 RepID=A0ABN2UG27_9ACTN